MRRLIAFAVRQIWLGFILAVALALRISRLGQLSFWYDEVVTMTVARSRGLSGVLTSLNAIDATRAPLHPILLHVWVFLFGTSERSGRGLSAASGVLTVVLVYRIAARLFASRATALISAWLVAVSPMLIVYSREARMYAWLALVTCAAWDALFSLDGSTSVDPATPSETRRIRYLRLTWYGLCVVALGYSHPLGLFMAVALAFAGVLHARAYRFTLSEWLIVHLAAATVLAAWLGRYVDHPPELITGRLPILYLFGTPIGWIGGNFLTLAGCLMLVCGGLFRVRRRAVNGRQGRPLLEFERPAAGVGLLVWLVLPVAFLWGYSLAVHPIFGPARYTLYCAPPFLILMARGMARAPRWLRALLLVGTTYLAASLIPSVAFAPDLKADWRAAAAMLSQADPSGLEPVLVTTNDPKQNLEIVTARYYLGGRRRTVALPVSPQELVTLRAIVPAAKRFWISSSVQDGWLTAEIPDWIPIRRQARCLDVNGLRLIAIEATDLPRFSPSTHQGSRGKVIIN